MFLKPQHLPSAVGTPDDANAVTFKDRLGCWLNERWKAELVLRVPRLARSLGLTWLNLCNRRERLLPDPISGGQICDWRDSSSLTLSRIFPLSGPRLFREATRARPIDFNFRAETATSEEPEVSFLIPFGGTERVAQLQLALAAVRAQRGVRFEVIVVEQSECSVLAGSLPRDVRHIHQRADMSAVGFNKSWALNRGAREAHAELLVLLDADFVVPADFAAEAARVLANVEAARPARLLFYLDERSTRSLQETSLPRIGIKDIVANTPMPVAVRRQTYWAVGGHDEAYFGWGGEDNEFLDRLRTRSISEGGWMPVVHAWHAPAPKKQSGERNARMHRERISVLAKERIGRLTQLHSGGDEPLYWSPEGKASGDDGVRQAITTEYLFDVRGEEMVEREIECIQGNARFRFVMDPALKRRKRFHAGIFFSKAVDSAEVDQYPRAQRVAVLTESPIDGSYRDVESLVRKFPVIFTHQQNLLESAGPFLPLMFGTNWLGAVDSATTQRVRDEPPAKTELASFIGSLEHAEVGAYRFRREVASFLMTHPEVHCFGRGIRPVQSKRDAIAAYRFSIAMENATSDFYFSEKLIDCILLETIPIYFGCPGIGQCLDERGMLQFKSLDGLRDLLGRLTPDLYAEMLPFALANKETVISQRWHNHAGLLQRLAESLPSQLLCRKPLRFKEPSAWQRYATRVRSRMRFMTTIQADNS